MSNHKAYALLQSRLSTPVWSSVAHNSMKAIAAAIVLIPASSAALTLSPLTVHSSIGQPFKASITATIGKGESLAGGCIQPVSPAGKTGGAANVQLAVPATKQPGSYVVQISSQSTINEPIYDLRVQASCPGTSVVTRSYTVMMTVPDTTPIATNSNSPAIAQPAAMVTENDSANPTSDDVTAEDTAPENIQSSTVTSGDVVAVPVAAATATPKFVTTGRILDPTGNKIANGSQYRVRNGDTLSSIAGRVSDQTGNATSDIASSLYSANPNAFVAGNPELIKLGYVLDIDTAASSRETSPAAATAVNEAQLPPAVTAASNTPAAERSSATDLAATEAAIQATEAEIARTEIELAEIEAAIAAAEASITTPDTLSDAGTNADSASATSVSAVASTLVAEDIAPELATTATPAAATTETLNSEPESTGVSGFLAILIGALVGLLATLLLLGKRLLSRFRPVTAEEAQATAEFTEPPTLGAAEADEFAQDDLAASTVTNVDELEEESVTGLAEDTRESVDGLELDFDLASIGTEAPPVATETAADTPRVSLHGDVEAAVDDTQFFVAPELNSDSPQDDYDGGGTMSELFGDAEEAAPIGDDAPTQELPDLLIADDAATEELLIGDNAATQELPISDDAATQEIPDLMLGDDAATQELPDLADSNHAATQELPELADLQSMAEHADELDDQMSENLTEAMGQLTEDYEEELSASQILNAEEIAEAFSAQAEAEAETEKD